MKKLLLPALLLSFLGSNSFALDVTTERTFKSAVLEEFTGIQCSNCPDAHQKANTLHHAIHDGFYAICIHAGSFAEPGRKQPNYIIAEGEAIHNYFGINSYPSGIISRRDNGYGLIANRSYWGACCRTATRDYSPVNLAIETAWDNTTRELSVEVGGYYTDDMTDPRLTVVVLQNNILGPQSGGLLGNDYPHRHMLRMMLSADEFGDPIAEKTKGANFTKTYKVTIPEAIKEVAFEPYDMEVVAFVAEGKNEIVKAVESFPEVASDENTRKVIVATTPLIPIGSSYALDYLELYLDNYSADEVTSATFDVTLNGEKRELSWNGNIPAHESKLIKIPLNGWWKSVYDSDTNEYSIKMTGANSVEPALEATKFKGSFANIKSYPSEMIVKIKTDNYAADNRYLIIDEDGNVVTEFGPYADGEAKTYEEHLSLESGKVYGLEITDAWGDGVYTPRGDVKFYHSDGTTLVAQFKEIKEYGMRSFFSTYEESGVNTILDDKEVVSEEYYDLTGRRVITPATGVYIIKQTYSNGNIKTSKAVLAK